MFLSFAHPSIVSNQSFIWKKNICSGLQEHNDFCFASASWGLWPCYSEKACQDGWFPGRFVQILRRIWCPLWSNKMYWLAFIFKTFLLEDVKLEIIIMTPIITLTLCFVFNVSLIGKGSKKWKFKMAFAILQKTPPPPLNGTNFQSFFLLHFFSFAIASYLIYEKHFTLGLSQKYHF